MDFDSVLRPMLNDDLGLVTDSDTEPWGSTDVRDEALKAAIRRLWPRMAKLMAENVTIVTGADQYELDYIWDLETLHVIDVNTRTYKEIRNFRNWVDHSDDDEEVRRILLPIHWAAGSTDYLQAIGYAPYTFTATGGGIG